MVGNPQHRARSNDCAPALHDNRRRVADSVRQIANTDKGTNPPPLFTLAAVPDNNTPGTPIKVFGERHPFGVASRWSRVGMEADCATLLRVGDRVLEGRGFWRVTGFRDGRTVLEAA